MAVSEQVCTRCGHDFCTECVVFPFGVSKGPLCISCALEAGGVSKQHTGRPKLAGKEIKRRVSNVPAPSAASSADTDDSNADDEADLDQAWLNGEVDVESSGGWSRTF
ncbi:MAG: hypothetical protein R2714_12735 [Microthrixaceae bacterium]